MQVTKECLQKVDGFVKEKGKFSLLSVIAEAPSPIFYSDLSSYIIGRSETSYPIWIWTKEGITPEQVLELEKDLDAMLEENVNKITCKKGLYHILEKDYDTSSYFEMGYLSCKEPIHPLKGKGVFVRPNYSDKLTLAAYWKATEKEMRQEEIQEVDALNQAQQWLEEKNFYVLKDATGKIVCMAGYRVMDDLAKITHVYTPVEERKKGYCKYLIYCLSKKLKEEGFQPILYTDYHYKASNKAYQDVGYQDEGILINFHINKEKKKKNTK